MSTNRLRVVCLGVSALCTLALAGCGGAPSADAPAKQEPAKEQTQAPKENKEKPAEAKDANGEAKDANAKAVSLSDWNGEWNSLTTYFDDAELQPVIEKAAKEKNESKDDLLKDLGERRHCDFGAVKIDGNKITYYDKQQKDGGKEIETVEYEWKESHPIKHGNQTLSFEIYESKDANAKYKLIAMMPIHGEEELTHFHMRYGASIDEMMKQEKWYPLLCKTETTYKQLEGEFSE